MKRLLIEGHYKVSSVSESKQHKKNYEMVDLGLSFE